MEGKSLYLTCCPNLPALSVCTLLGNITTEPGKGVSGYAQGTKQGKSSMGAYWKRRSAVDILMLWRTEPFYEIS